MLDFVLMSGIYYWLNVSLKQGGRVRIMGDGGGLEESLYVSRREKTINNGSY